MKSENPSIARSKKTRMTASNNQIDEDRTIDPGKTAALLLKSRAVRIEQLRNDQPDIDDIAWHILLVLKVSMNADQPVTMLDLAIRLNVAKNIMVRYVEYLIGTTLIAKPADALDKDLVPLQLTASGDALTGDILQKISQELVNG
tara:strand:- start:504 stop:938 length:435 start_codon:yes stop_codon:yes gene_type:complete